MEFIETGTGLDAVIDSVLSNEDLRDVMTDREINKALKAATKLNAIVVEAIRETGVIEDVAVPASLASQLLFTRDDFDTVADYIQDNYARKFGKLMAKADALFEDSVWNVDTGYEFVWKGLAGAPLGGMWSATVPYSTLSYYIKDDLQSGVLFQSADDDDGDDRFEFRKRRH